jgi:hypothetical protein
MSSLSVSRLKEIKVLIAQQEAAEVPTAVAEAIEADGEAPITIAEVVDFNL